MKRLIIVSILILSFNDGYLSAQNLTKQETINYLNKLLKPANGAFINNSKWRILENEIVALEDNKLIITGGMHMDSYSNNGYYSPEELVVDQYTFPITKIINQECFHVLQNGNDVKGCIHIEILFKDPIVKREVVKEKNSISKLGEIRYVNYVDFYIDGQEPENFSRLKKAFLYLSELCKAEGNPFD